MNIQKLLQTRLLYFLFTIPHKVASKDFAYFLGTADFKNNQLLTGQDHIHRMHDSLSICVVLGRNLEENSCSESFYKTGEVIDEGFAY